MLKYKPFEHNFKLELLHAWHNKLQCDKVESQNINDLNNTSKNGYNVMKGHPTPNFQYQIFKYENIIKNRCIKCSNSFGTIL